MIHFQILQTFLDKKKTTQLKIEYLQLLELSMKLMKEIVMNPQKLNCFEAEYESNGDKYIILSLGEYLQEIRLHLKNLINSIKITENT